MSRQTTIYTPGQTTTYTQREDGYFYGLYNEDEFEYNIAPGVTMDNSTINPPKKNVPFGPAYKIIAPGAIPPLTIYDVKENAIFVPKNDVPTPDMLKKRGSGILVALLYVLSTSPRGLVKKDDPNAKKYNTAQSLPAIPDSFCLDATPCIPGIKCCNTNQITNWIKKTFGPNGIIIVIVLIILCALIVSSSSSLILFLIKK
jgi:hypothetical protein